MGTTIKVSLSADSLLKAAEAVRTYKDSLKDKCREFREQLIDIGISTGESNCGKYAGMIVFKRDDEGADKSLLVATDGKKVIREWRYRGDTKSVEVSPLLMAEFGSGWFSENLLEVAGVGQGTFPDQKHAFDEGGWRWTTLDNVTHHSVGEIPTHPMYAAMMQMQSDIDRIARQVFGTDEVIQC